MAQTTLDEKQLKELFKQAILELSQERKDLLYDVFAEALEDLAIINSIKEGEDVKCAPNLGQENKTR